MDELPSFIKSAAFIILVSLIGIIPSTANAAEFKVLFVGQQTIEDQNCIAVTFSAKVDATKDFNRFLKLFSDDDGQVDGAWVLSEKADVAYFTNVEADTQYEVQIRKGIRSAFGQTLSQTKTHKMRTRKATAYISFSSKGYILPSELANGIPVSTMNVKAADVDFFRIKEKFLVDFLNLFNHTRQMDWSYSEQIKRWADLVYSARFDFEARKNVLTKAILPIAGIKSLAEPGVYLAVLQQAGIYGYQYPATYFSVSDIGMHMRVYPQKMVVQTQHLSSGKVYKDVSLSFYDRKGNVIEQGRTDKSGTAAFARIMEKSQLLVARKGKHTSILPLIIPALDLSAFELGDQPFRNLELFVYGPRDLYRPGETMIMDALLRDYDGRPLDRQPPISVHFRQPDGQKIKSMVWHSEASNAFHYDYDLPAGAQTGTWTVEFKLAGELIQLYKFKVEDFMPERMKLDLDDGNLQVTRIGTSDPISMGVQGDYLYGAPAAGNRVGCNVHMALQRSLVEALPGFEFGDVDEKVRTEFQVDDIELDDQGHGVIQVENQYESVRSPIKVRLHTSLYESGGRPVSRHKVYHVWPARQLVGVRPLWEGEQPATDAPVEFEVVKTDADGTLLGAKGLVVTLIREYPDFYWEFNAASGWEQIVNYQHYPVADRKLDISAGEKAVINFPVEWGPYRLEITDPDNGLKTSHRFSAGWRWYGRGAGEQGSRPDQVVLTLDKKSYKPGDTAKVLIKAPEAGTAVVAVESDQPLWRHMVKVETAGTQVAIPVGADWDRHDLHVTAMVIRPGNRRKKIAPKRALGIVHLPLERGDRTMSVTIDAPDKTQPNTTLGVDVRVANAAVAGGDVFVTLAAVDVGVLSITGFETPDPSGYFFNRRRYGVDYYDLYQKIIESHEGSLARQRFGGDGVSSMTRGGDKPVTDVQIVSLYQGRVKVDTDGSAKISMDLPDFNGRLRLMAVAYTDRRYGSAEKEVTVASPVVTQIAMPRFLAMGDDAFLALDVQNLSGREQSLDVSLKTSAPIELVGSGVRELQLKDKAKTTLRFAVKAGYAVGSGDIDLVVGGIRLEEGADRLQIKRHWSLGTRPAYPAVTRQWRMSLEPGKVLEIPADALKHLLPDTVSADLTLTDQPPISVAEHIRELYAYPYGCLEQTTSGIYPQVLINNEMLKQLKIASQSAEQRHKKVQKGIDRLMTMQKPNGGFGLWSNSSPEECWLTAYVCDFLISARDRGFEVPENALKKAVDRLNKYLRRPKVIKTRYSADKQHTRLAVQAYSGYVLARLNKASLGTLRTLFDNHSRKSRSGLPLVHLGLALQLQGDAKRARKAFDQALSITRDRHHYYGEYGSPIRDAAMSYYLLSTQAHRSGHADTWLIKLDEVMGDRPWLSTQERNALVLAGMQILKGSGQTWQANVTADKATTKIRADKLMRYVHDAKTLAGGLRIEAVGDRPVFVNFLLNGYGKTAPPPESNILEIDRTYYDLKGEEISLRNLKTGDLVLVRLDVQTDKRVSEALVVELLPAGWEPENQNLSTSFKLDELKVDGMRIEKWKEHLRLAHEEFRDDRYVAAIDVAPSRPATLFYLARVVTPGVFQVPNAYVEDMYRPYIRALGDTVAPITIKQP